MAKNKYDSIEFGGVDALDYTRQRPPDPAVKAPGPRRSNHTKARPGLAGVWAIQERPIGEDTPQEPDLTPAVIPKENRDHDRRRLVSQGAAPQGVGKKGVLGVVGGSSGSCAQAHLSPALARRVALPDEVPV